MYQVMPRKQRTQQTAQWKQQPVQSSHVAQLLFLRLCKKKLMFKLKKKLKKKMV